MATLTKDEQKAWAFVKSQNAPVSSRQYGAHLKKDSKTASKIFSALVKKGKLEFISQTDDDGITRHYYLLPDTKPVVKAKPVEEPKPVVEVKPVEEPKSSPLKDVYDENHYEHNMKLLAKSFFNYIEKDLQIKVSVAPAPKEKEPKDPNAPKLSKEEKKELDLRKKIERDSAARREHLRDMLKTWFPAWAHIQSLRFTNPTGRFRTQEEINQSLKEGVMA